MLVVGDGSIAEIDYDLLIAEKWHHISFTDAKNNFLSV